MTTGVVPAALRAAKIAGSIDATMTSAFFATNSRALADQRRLVVHARACVGPSVVDDEVASLDVALRREALLESGEQPRGSLRRRAEIARCRQRGAGACARTKACARRQRGEKLSSPHV
jgi:hypothetical protein